MRNNAVVGALAFMLAAMPIKVSAADGIPELSPERQTVVGCLGEMDVENGSTWGQCMEMLFQPCAAKDVGSEDHLQCLLAEREAWFDGIEHEHERVVGMITAKGGTELTQIMSQWYGYVGKKCASVGANNVGTKAEVAQTGCEIAEIASVVSELVSCSQLRSKSPYCVIKEE